MFFYYVMFLLPAFVAAGAGPLRNIRLDGSRRVRLDGAWILVMVFLTAIVGLRDRVGGDWFNYLYHYLVPAQNLTLPQALLLTDPGYWVLNVLSSQWGLGIVGVNLVAGLIFAVGLVVYCRSLPRPWLALSVAMPYLVLVGAMGYSRQGVALGFILLSLVAASSQRFVWFVICVTLAATFHRSAAIMMGIVLLTLDLRRLYMLPVLAVAVLFIYSAFLEESADNLRRIYIEGEIESSGALIRLALNALPASLFLWRRNHAVLHPAERRLFTVMSLLALGSFLALLAGVLPSTALDRMALYLLPLQLFVFSHLPDMIGRRGGRNQGIVIMILLLYACVLFVWLNFATNARYWIPYRSFPPMDVIEATLQRR